MARTRRDQTPTALDRVRAGVDDEVAAKFAPVALTKRKRVMVEAYVRTGSFKKAAKASGYSPSTVSKYIKKDDGVRAAIHSQITQAALVSGITFERVLEEYARLAFSNVGDLLETLYDTTDPDACLASLQSLAPAQTAAIKTIEMSRKTSGDGGFETGTFKLHLHDKKGALTDLARMLSAFNDKITINDDSAYGERLRRAHELLQGGE